jgi:hypothetical protein
MQCLTADAWGSKRRSFLGVTAHWLEIRSLVADSRPSSIPWTSRCPNEFRPILDVKKSSNGLTINDGLRPSSTYVPWLSVFGLFGIGRS